MEIDNIIKRLDNDIKLDFEVNIDNIDIDGVYIVNTKLNIKKLGSRTIPKAVKSLDNIENIVHEQIKEILDSYNIDASKYLKKDTNDKVTNIDTAKENDSKENEKEENEKNEKNNKEEIKLSEEDMNMWTSKSNKVYKDEINRLIKNKKELNIKNNEDLLEYITNFDKTLESVTDIIPKNIKDFNDYLESVIKKQEGKAV